MSPPERNRKHKNPSQSIFFLEAWEHTKQGNNLNLSQEKTQSEILWRMLKNQINMFPSHYAKIYQTLICNYARHNKLPKMLE